VLANQPVSSHFIWYFHVTLRCYIALVNKLNKWIKFNIKSKQKPAYPPATTLTNARWRWRKCATTMYTYWSSFSRPLPMKHRCSPAATALALNACSLLVSSACTAVVNSDRLSNIWCDINSNGLTHSLSHNRETRNLKSETSAVLPPGQ